jgi:hypothetical protein
MFRVIVMSSRRGAEAQATQQHVDRGDAFHFQRGLEKEKKREKVKARKEQESGGTMKMTMMKTKSPLKGGGRELRF